jgi:hypothetical protein
MRFGEDIGNKLYMIIDGFGGLVVSMLASGSQVRGFDPDQSRWIFNVVFCLRGIYYWFCSRMYDMFFLMCCLLIVFLIICWQ